MRLIVWLLLWLSFNAYSQLTITHFYDGDTVKINDGVTKYKLRLSDIDAPERNQSYGKKSRRALMQFCKDMPIQVYVSGIDKYQRSLGKLHCNQQDVSLLMIQNGHAWFNSRYSADGTLAFAEQSARKNKLGLWKSKKPLPPWVWRQKHPQPFSK
ncbi:MAG: thermonuclease family protein [Methylophilaceae bacterium]